MGEIPCPFVFATQRQTNIVSLSFFKRWRVKETSKNRIILLCYILTVFAWGSGFVFQDQALAHGLAKVPGLINVVRFVTATLVCAVVFGKRIKLNKQSLLYGVLCGVGLFFGFFFQLTALEHTTPANCGFYSTSYIIFVPVFSYFFFKKRTKRWGLLGIGIAIVGLLVLNYNALQSELSDEILLGNLFAVCSALSFAYHISMTDKALYTVGAESLTFVQCAVACVCFVGYFFVKYFAIEGYDFAVLGEIELGAVWWRVGFVALIGTGFAYISQTYAQKILAPAETSLIMSTESVISALLSIVVGIDKLTWQLVVGGVLAFSAVVVAEVVPAVIKKRKAVETNSQNDDNVVENAGNDLKDPKTY